VIWHIFKKDARLLWWMAAGVAALEFAKVGILLKMGLFPQNPRLYLLSQLLSIGGILGVGFAIVAVVHLDTIPGVRQDWLVRPIRRRDLLWAKLLFVVLMVQSPILLANFIEAVANGFPLGASLAAASSRSLFLLLLIDIPFLAFASLTRNMLEAITGGVAIFFAVATALALVTGGGNRILRQPVLGTGLEWIAASALVLVMLAGSAAVLSLQFIRRRTFLARCLTGAVASLAFLTTFLPWQPAFALEHSLSSAPGTAHAVGLTFNPGAGRFERDPALPGLDMRNDSIPVFLPVSISGLPEGAGLQSDHVEIRAIEPDGHVDTIDSVRMGGLSTLRERSSDGTQHEFQPLVLSGDLYHRLKEQPVRLELDYSLTLFQFTTAHALPAIDGRRRIPNVGYCETRINNAETAVQIGCKQAGWKPGCETFLLEHAPSGRRNPARFACWGADYAPYLNWELIPDSLWRFGGNLPFRNAAGVGRYPVDGSMLRESQVVMRLYEPVDHFARKLTIAEVRLGDWEAAPARQ
jgi:hypothetical protein